MTIPDTGTDWIGAGFDQRSPEHLRWGMAVATMARNPRGSATDLSPHNPDGSIRWSPYAADFSLRDDLIGRLKNADGIPIVNPDPNEGFIHLGPQKDGDGPAWKAKVSSEQFMILQDVHPYDSLITEKSKSFTLSPVDTGDEAVQRLHANRPFYDAAGNLLLGDAGVQNAVYADPAVPLNTGWQFLIFRQRDWNGLPIYSCDVVPLARQIDLGGFKMTKKDSEAQEIGYLPVPDGRCMAFQDGKYQRVPGAYRIWGGEGFAALGGYATFPGSAPVATATTALHATLAFTQPTGPSDPWEYKVQQSTDAGSTWGELITPSSVSVSAGTVTLALAAVAGASKFRAVAKGTNGVSTLSANSNSATIAAS
jgi:hypothetical protein